MQTLAEVPRIRARLEYPLAEEAQPDGILAADLDGEGHAELIIATRAPGSLQIAGGFSPSRAGIPEPRVLGIGDYPLGPVWLSGNAPRTKNDSALVAVASRATRELIVLDARRFWRPQGEDEGVRSRTQLERRPRVLAAGQLGHDQLGHDQKGVLAVVTIDDDCLLFQGPDDFTQPHPKRKLRLCDDKAVCARFLGDGGGILFGFQGSRRVVLYVPSNTNPFGLEPGPSVTLKGLPRALLTLDLDHDGDEELVVAGGDKSVWIFGLGAEGGVPAALASTPLEIETGTVPIDLAAADLDGDGSPQIVCLALHSQQQHLLAWRGGKLVSGPLVYAGQDPWHAVFADLDGDGALDLAVTNPGAARVSTSFGDGHGGLVTAERAQAGRSPHSLAAADLDGDGRPDVIALNALEGTLSIFHNEHGTLADGRRSGKAANADALAVGDLDGDGKIDAAFLRQANGACALVMLFGDGKGELWERAAVDPLVVGVSMGDLLLDDQDGDGRPEVLISDPEKNRVALFALDSKPHEDPRFGAPIELALGDGPRAFARLDARDGHARVAVALGGPGARTGIAIVAIEKGPDGRLALREEQFLGTKVLPLAIASADLDGDGALDLALLATSSTGGDAVGLCLPWLQDSRGHFRSLAPLHTGARPYRVAAADLNGDHRAEILVTAQNSHHVNLWIAHADGASVRFVPSADLGVGTGPLDIELVDLDGDGVCEIVVANAFSDDLTIVRTRTRKP